MRTVTRRPALRPGPLGEAGAGKRGDESELGRAAVQRRARLELRRDLAVGRLPRGEIAGRLRLALPKAVALQQEMRPRPLGLQFSGPEDQERLACFDRLPRGAQHLRHLRLLGSREEALVAATSERARLQAELAESQQHLALLEAGSRSEEIDEAEAQLRAAEAQLQLAVSGRHRVAQRGSELAAAAAEVERQRASLRAARASHVRVQQSQQQTGAQRAEMRLARANWDLAREQLQQTVLRSPITGQVTRRQAEPGQSVNADQRDLLEITDDSTGLCDPTLPSHGYLTGWGVP
jgi:biotin carboxyl carrier protein